MFIDSMMLINHLILCHPLVLLPSNYLNIRVFSRELALHIRWQKYWSFNFSISTSNEYSRLISLRTDCFDFLAVQGTHKGLQQNVQASILWHSAIFMDQLSHLYMTTEKTIASTIWTFVGEDSWESLGQQRRSNQSILKDINPKYSFEGLMLKLKCQYFGHLMQRADSFPWCW